MKVIWRWNGSNCEGFSELMEGLFWNPTYPQTEGIACPHAINYITFWYLSFGLNSVWYHLLKFCKVFFDELRLSFGLNSAWYHLLNFGKVFLMNCNLVGSCVSTIFCLLHSMLMYDLCIMWFLLQSIFVGMHHGWFLCDNHDCVASN